MSHVLAITRFDGLTPSDPPGQAVVATYVTIVTETGVTPAGETAGAFPVFVTVPFATTPNQLASAVRAEVLAELGRQGYEGVVASDVIAASSYTRG